MKNFLRTALIITLVLALALVIVACDKKPAETTKAPGTDKPVVTTTAKGGEPTNPTTAATTTATPATSENTTTPTTAPVTTVAPPTDAPYDMEVPCAKIEGSDKKIYAIWNCEYFVVTDEGWVTVDEGCNASIATLVYEDGTPVKWTKGTIEYVLQVTDPENYTSNATRGPGANDSGMIIGIADVEQEALRDYFWESQRPYVMIGCSDACGLLSASNGRVRASGTAGWSNLFDASLNKWPLIPDFAHGDELRIKIESDGEGTLLLYAQDMDNPMATLVFPEAPESEDKSNPFLTGSGVGIRAEIPSVTYKEIIITMAD